MGVTLERDAGVAVVTLDRPGSHNALDATMIDEFAHAATQLRSDSSVRAVLIRASGAHFCVGGDVKAFAGNLDRLPEFIGEIVDVFHQAITDISSLAVPVVSAVRGSAAGGGLSIACLGDLLIAGRSANFVVAYSAIGLSPDGGSSWALPRLVGSRLALDLFLTNRALDADQALAAGLVSRVVDDDQLDEEAEALVRRLANGPTMSFAAGKRLLNMGPTAVLADQLAQEKASIVALSGSVDGLEGVRAFAGKRPAEFEGR